MSTGPKWQWTPPRLGLLSCAIGVHKFHFRQAYRDAGRDTLRECYVCGLVQVRDVCVVGSDTAVYLPWSAQK